MSAPTAPTVRSLLDEVRAQRGGELENELKIIYNLRQIDFEIDNLLYKIVKTKMGDRISTYTVQQALERKNIWLSNVDVEHRCDPLLCSLINYEPKDVVYDRVTKQRFKKIVGTADRRSYSEKHLETRKNRLPNIVNDDLASTSNTNTIPSNRFVPTGFVYVCRETGKVHLCNEQCNYVVNNKECMVCPLTGRVAATQYCPFSKDEWWKFPNGNEEPQSTVGAGYEDVDYTMDFGAEYDDDDDAYGGRNEQILNTDDITALSMMSDSLIEDDFDKDAILLGGMGPFQRSYNAVGPAQFYNNVVNRAPKSRAALKHERMIEHIRREKTNFTGVGDRVKLGAFRKLFLQIAEENVRYHSIKHDIFKLKAIINDRELAKKYRDIVSENIRKRDFPNLFDDSDSNRVEKQDVVQLNNIPIGDSNSGVNIVMVTAPITTIGATAAEKRKLNGVASLHSSFSKSERRRRKKYRLFGRKGANLDADQRIAYFSKNREKKIETAKGVFYDLIITNVVKLKTKMWDRWTAELTKIANTNVQYIIEKDGTFNFGRAIEAFVTAFWSNVENVCDPLQEYAVTYRDYYVDILMKSWEMMLHSPFIRGETSSSSSSSTDTCHFLQNNCNGDENNDECKDDDEKNLFSIYQPSERELNTTSLTHFKDNQYSLHFAKHCFGIMYCMSTGGLHLPVSLESNKSVVHIIPNDKLVHNDIKDVTQFCKKNNKRRQYKFATNHPLSGLKTFKTSVVSIIAERTKITKRKLAHAMKEQERGEIIKEFWLKMKEMQLGKDDRSSTSSIIFT